MNHQWLYIYLSLEFKPKTINIISFYETMTLKWCVDFNVPRFEMINAIFPTECKTVSKCCSNCFYHGDVIHWNFNLGNSLFIRSETTTTTRQFYSIKNNSQSNFDLCAFCLINMSTHYYMFLFTTLYKFSQSKIQQLIHVWCLNNCLP